MVSRPVADLGDGFVLAHCLDSAFPSTPTAKGSRVDPKRGLASGAPASGEHDSNTRPPMSPEAFFRCITEVVMSAAELRVALLLPVSPCND